ncbi:hypothetical protein SAMN05421803_103458 [Nocardiopsis flavescens]|uniref:Uncharacterized protein n=1 Tax=Nocardiopsis flavescens TaxID=758803 RepID=A0A1M6GLX8_9ACTN|nr:hypothetical protein SAMN05421803_103458 [Nocardiopsis flavescens]
MSTPEELTVAEFLRLTAPRRRQVPRPRTGERLPLPRRNATAPVCPPHDWKWSADRKRQTCRRCGASVRLP